jgi:TolA-binding protein
MIKPELKAPPADTAEPVTNKYTEAYNLNARICVNAQMAQQNLYEVCKGLKEMRDGKLYKELGYQNFEDYCENEVGISRFMAYKYISIAELKNVESIQQIGVTKLALLAKLDEPQREEIQQNVNVEEVSVRELKEKIAELKIKADKADMLSNRLDDMNKICERISDQRDKAENKIKRLEAEIEELESRPVEVAVESDTAEIEKLNSIIKQTDLEWGKKYSELEEENIKLRQEDFRKHAAEIEQLRSDYERRLSEAEKSLPAEPVFDTKEVFKAYLSNAVDAVKRLVSFVQKYPDEAIFRDKTKELFNSVNKTMEV